MSVRYIACKGKFSNYTFHIYKQKPNRPYIVVSSGNAEKVQEKLSQDGNAFRDKLEEEFRPIDNAIEDRIKVIYKERDKLYDKLNTAENEEMERLVKVFSEDHPEYLI